MSRPKIHCTNLSDEAFMALLDALGFQNEGNQRGEDLRKGPLETFSRNSYSNLDVLCKYEDTPPGSRRCSFICGVDTVASSNLVLSASPDSVPSKGPTRIKRPRPSPLYFPNRVPVPITTSISESMCSLQSDPSAWKESVPDSRISTNDTPSICIKAAFNATIVVLRISRTISFAELKQRLYDKFVGQEGMPLSRPFIVMSVRPPSNKQNGTLSAPGLGRTRSSHPSTFRKDRSSSWVPRRFSFEELTQMRFIEDEVDWQKIVFGHYADGTKVTVRILDTPV